ncbi:small subunit rRNA maturation protein TSR4 [Aspergillus clavatus NRRL 1]|uniref:PDCD2_C domain protein, putative n=1 Tax=Aspergillus clavatus (strain ATCC 1007 / CBS 513.65 / DSM 816 / NCTC 3887 / NRRL 1 / QM 1276 / 107) TaxID=344612 RepID=A1CK45_ASPCL|nr:PDCD2_C domain protein, putative [Aspergillus clavatus NRRL 1]EAW09519.1 PDCD2_C domain protein, putative [Aspergillus clavatus NRRL 1]
MDPYDSDSSGSEDEGDFTETGVLLGYASEEILDDTISHLGGWPTWLDDSTLPPGEFANCKVCNSPMLLLLELHGDLPEHFPDDERRLYIFGCPKKACNKKPGSIRALRAVRKTKVEQAPRNTEEKPKEDTEKKAKAPKQDIGASLFGGTSLIGSVSANPNPFSSSNALSSQASNPFAAPATSSPVPAKQTSTTTPSTTSLSESFADKVRVSSPPPTTAAPESAAPAAPWPDKSAFPAPYTQFYLDAEYETLSRPSTPTIPANVTIDNTEEEEAAGGSTDLKDTFESELDKAFMKFSTRLEHNPEQILRYEFRGTPLLYSYSDPVGKLLHDPKHGSGSRVTTVASGASRFPRCQYCGSERVFELQLVPHAIAVLEEGREGVGLGPKDDAGMEWGTIILGVCSKDCGPQQVGVVGWREEWAGVQWEESVK